MAGPPTPPERVFGGTPESAEFRRTHYRVYDEDGFASSFATGPPDYHTLEGVSARLCATFRGTGGTGYDSKDLVVLLGPRIVAVVRKGWDGGPVVTRFED